MGYKNLLDQLSFDTEQFKWDIVRENKPTPPREKLKYKVPMQQVCIAEDGAIWQYFVAQNKVWWVLRGYTFFEP
jgi:hypothetical protein